MSNYLKVNKVSDNVELVAPMKTVFRDGMGYYTPEVDAEGNLTWTPSNSDIPEVSESMNIMGPAGKDGKPGADGEPGAKGEPGNSGVYIGATEPTTANVWINPDGVPTVEYVDKAYVDEKISEIQLEAGAVSSVNGKAGAVVLTAEDVGALPADTVIPSTAGLATEEYVDKAVENVSVDLTGYATEDYVDKAIADAQLSGGDADLTNYYTKSETDAAIAEELKPYALKTELPSTSGFITEAALEPYALKTELPDTTGFIKSDALEPYALKTEVPSIEGLATEKYVDDAIANIPSSGGGSAAADEKTIVTNAEGKLETAIGGYVSSVSEPIVKNEYNGEFTNPADNNGWITIGKSGKYGDLPWSWFDNDETMDFYITIYDASEDKTIDFVYTEVYKEDNGSTYRFNFPGNQYFPYVFINYPDSTAGTWIIQDNSSYWQRTLDKVLSFKACISPIKTYSPINILAVPIDNTTIINNGGKLSSSVPLQGGNGNGSLQSIYQNDNATSSEYATNLGAYNTVRGIYAFAAGNQNSINGNGQYAGAIGMSNVVQAGRAMAFGMSNQSKGANGVVCGANNNSIAMSGFVAGADNSVMGNSYCYAIGDNLKVGSSNQVVIGTDNQQDTAGTYLFIMGKGSSTNAMTVDKTGNVAAAGQFTATGADYAEFFEWLDGNPDNEDRVGYMVTLSGNQIRFADSDDEVLGIISGTAIILGDNAEWNWQGKYQKDDFGRIIYDMVEKFADIPEVDEEGNETIKTVSIGFFPVARLNPNYNPEEVYIKRSERPEWATVGMMGKLYVRDDGTCKVGGYATPYVHGIATAATKKTNMRVMERVSENIIKVLLK